MGIKGEVIGLGPKNGTLDTASCPPFFLWIPLCSGEGFTIESGNHQFGILIPAFEPEPGLVDLVKSLRNKTQNPIVVVNDGSVREESLEIFRQLKTLTDVSLVEHVTNLGKGAALKTGLNHMATHFPDLKGVVTADADGQHQVEDILKVGEGLNQNENSLVLGIRDFGEQVPLRSRFGNLLTIQILHWVSNIKLQDTQTGLRGIPKNLIPIILKSKSNHYEFELDMLILARQNKFKTLEVPIQTIYIDDNKSSHFNPIIDSMKIYFVFLRFTAVSILSAMIDYVFFIFVFSSTGHLLGSQYGARTLAGAFNFAINKRETFKNKGPILPSLLRYCVLLYSLGIVSYALIKLILEVSSLSVPAAKMLAEGSLFFANFAVQKLFVFSDEK